MEDIWAEKPNKANVKTITGFLATALDLEDQISGGVYRHYLDFKNWPATLKEDTFKTIKEHLNTLIDDTERHIEIFSNLMDKIDNNENK